MYTTGNLQLEDVAISPKTVCVTTLPCKILITILFMFTFIHYFKKVDRFTLIVNLCQNFTKIFLKALFLTIITSLIYK